MIVVKLKSNCGKHHREIVFWQKTLTEILLSELLVVSKHQVKNKITTENY